MPTKEDFTEKWVRSLKKQLLKERDWKIVEELGRGTFSRVYKAIPAGPTAKGLRPVALKVIVPSSRDNRIENEIAHLQLANGAHGVIPLTRIDRFELYTCLAMPLVPHDHFHHVINAARKSLDMVRIYFTRLLTALAHIHQLGIIHRDVKPRNFLFSLKARSGVLVDFGLSQMVSQVQKKRRPSTGRSQRAPSDRVGAHGSKRGEHFVSAAHKRTRAQGDRTGAAGERAKRGRSEAAKARGGGGAASAGAGAGEERDRPGIVAPRSFRPLEYRNRRGRLGTLKDPERLPPQRAERAGTPGFRAPEVLMRVVDQDQSIDVWSAGVILLCLLIGEESCFYFSEDRDDSWALMQVVELLGPKAMQAAAEAVGKELILPSAADDDDGKPEEDRLRALVLKRRPDAPDSAIQLLKGCLDPNPKTRLSALDALKSEFLQIDA